MTRRKSNGSNRFWKWRTSTKSASDLETRDIPYLSPTASPSQNNLLPRVSELPPVPPSPYVSESAHVFSLQHPSFLTLPDPHDPIAIPSWTETRERSERSERQPALTTNPRRPCRLERGLSRVNLDRKLHSKTKRGIGSKLGFRSRKGVTSRRTALAMPR